MTFSTAATPGKNATRRASMDVDQLIADARDALTVKRVLGEPYEHNGVTVLPVAKVQVVAVLALLTWRSVATRWLKSRSQT
jgi:hypothetical protein